MSHNGALFVIFYFEVWNKKNAKQGIRDHGYCAQIVKRNSWNSLDFSLVPIFQSSIFVLRSRLKLAQQKLEKNYNTVMCSKIFARTSYKCGFEVWNKKNGQQGITVIVLNS